MVVVRALPLDGVAVTVTVYDVIVVPVEVPPPPLLPLFKLPPPPPQLTVADAATITSAPSNAIPRSLVAGRPQIRSEIRNIPSTVASTPGKSQRFGQLRGESSVGSMADGAVVFTVSVLAPLLPLPVRATELLAVPLSVNPQVGKSLTLVSKDGATAQLNATLPLKPVDVTVTAVFCDCPGAEIVSVTADGSGANVKPFELTFTVAEVVVDDVA
jgi:hypothetical protein